jgi:hypothetical protein
MPLLTNKWVTWKYFVDLMKEQLDMTGLSHDEILRISKEQNQEMRIFGLGRMFNSHHKTTYTKDKSK